MEKNCYDKPEYKDWRDALRRQLGFSGQLYLGFATAILGFTINYLIEHPKITTGSKTLLLISCGLFIFSIILGSWFVLNRLFDFRRTAELYGKCKDVDEVMVLTRCMGKLTWVLFIIQIIFFAFAFILSVIGFSLIII